MSEAHTPPRIRTPRGVLFSWRKEKGGFELGASKLKFAYSPLGEKIVQWTILREAREKQIPFSPSRKKDHQLMVFFVVVIS